MEVVTLQAEPRTTLGKSASKSTRRSDNVPCVLYGGKEVHHFTVKPLDLRDLVYTPQFKTVVVELGGTSYNCILKDIQVHPVTEKIMHADFLRLIDNHPIKVEVPVSFEGVAQGLKSGGKMIKKVRKVKIKSLPSALVDKLVLDTTSMGLGQTQRVRDLEVPAGVEVLNNSSIPLATIDIPRALRQAATEEAKNAASGKKK